ncbi:Na(+)/citrate cotransporter-like isoform X2 [Argiope bruennichi]|nr:Na(+)/citrate cotransporter-like isoform X2 [Argiope bruennichi]XP_055935977.1 Na(+)/citrate cotransporter-like isoform X2 [Argiope bruennichi]
MKWKIFVYLMSVILPFVLLPLALSSHQELQCAYVMIIIAAYWILEPVSIAAVAMLPMVLFPVLGIISATEVCKNYMKEGYMAFIGGVMAALSMESCKLHERIALKVLLLVGAEIKWLLLGLMLTTTFMSMWMSNTATTALMVTIVDALVGEISSNTTEMHLDENNAVIGSNYIYSLEEIGKTRNTTKSKRNKSCALRITLLLGVCYAANIGGTGTLIGTGSNLAFIAMLEKIYPGSEEISFATWMMYNVPGVFLCTIIGWFYLWLINIYFSKMKQNDESKDEIYGIISKRYGQLGTLTSHEISVIVLFSLLIALWIFRDPKFIPGWYTALGFKLKVGDSTTAIAILFLMFFLPSNFRDLDSPRILEWKTAQAKFPWAVIFLVGSGASLAQGAQVSGLSHSIGSMLSALKALPPGLIVTITCFSTAAATEIFSNLTTTVILLPILSQMALSIGINPLYLMLPATVVSSYAFMLPVATIPNAIVFEEGNMKTLDMLKPGIAMNILCCCIQLATLHTIGVPLFDLNKFPSWTINSNLTSIENVIFNATQIQNNTSIL